MKIHPSPPSPVSSIHSTISSSSSSSSSSFSPSSSPRGRCQGLDLLVKAVYHVAGSVIGVPYIQRRIIRRRKPALRFQNYCEFRSSCDRDGEVILGDFVLKQSKFRKKRISFK